MIRLLSKVLFYLLLALILVPAAFRGWAALRETESADAFAPATGRFIDTDMGRIFTQSAGPEAGTPILLAHGTAAWSGFWRSEIAALADAGYTATAFDMPPFGYSDHAPNGDYRRTVQADRILALAEAMQSRPILVAHSFGAAAAAEAALRRPGAFAGLIIVDGAIGMTVAADPAFLPLPLRPRVLREAAVSLTVTNPLMMGPLLKQMLHDKGAATPARIETLKAPMRRRGTTRAYARWLPSLLAPAPDTLSRSPEEYKDIDLPVRILWGDEDSVTPPAQAEALARAIGQAPVTYIEGAGHIPHIERPEAFMAALLRALDEIAPD